MFMMTLNLEAEDELRRIPKVTPQRVVLALTTPPR